MDALWLVILSFCYFDFPAVMECKLYLNTLLFPQVAFGDILSEKLKSN